MTNTRNTAVTSEQELEAARRQGFEDAIIKLAQQSNPTPQPQHHGYRPTAFERFSKHRPPSYEGSDNPIVLENWLEEMEKLLELSQIPAEERITVTAYYLKEEANSWWQLMKQNYLDTDGFEWEDFRALLEDKFYPEEMKWQKEEEFQALRMGTMTLAAYTKKYTELSKYARNMVPTEAELAKRYVRRMEPKLRQLMLTQNLTTYQAAYEKALTLNAAIQENNETKKKKKSFTPHVSSSSFIQKPTFNRPTFTKPNFENRSIQTTPTQNFSNNNTNINRFVPNRGNSGLCNMCKKPSHPGKQCNGSPIVCFHCNEPGHKVTTCPKKGNTATGLGSASASSVGSTMKINGKVYALVEVEE